VAAITRVYTLRRAAQILERDEDLLWNLADQLDPEDGCLWVYDVDDVETLAFTPNCLDILREIIADQIDQTK
jgi:hypothetical protein